MFISLSIWTFVLIKIVEPKMIISSFTISVAILSILYLALEDKIMLEIAKKSFINKDSLPIAPCNCILDRKETKIEKIFESDYTNFYYIVYGLNGIGKS